MSFRFLPDAYDERQVSGVDHVVRLRFVEVEPCSDPDCKAGDPDFRLVFWAPLDRDSWLFDIGLVADEVDREYWLDSQEPDGVEAVLRLSIFLGVPWEMISAAGFGPMNDTQSRALDLIPTAMQRADLEEACDLRDAIREKSPMRVVRLLRMTHARSREIQ